MGKTYVPTLRVVVRHAQLYMTRWQALIEENLTEDQIAAFRSCLSCLIDLVAALGPEPVDE